MIAVTRPLTPSIARCELTHLQREPIDFQRAVRQHEAYEEALSLLGCQILRLPAETDLPDAVFVEDTAVVLEEVAVITRPGAESRRRETESMARLLGEYRELRSIEEPGTLDGGDVLRIGRRVWVGLSGRSNREGIRQLREHLAPFGCHVVGAAFGGCLHLKSAATPVAEGLLLVNRGWVDPTQFEGLAFVEVDPAEPFAANALLLGGKVIHPAGFPRTRALLEQRGSEVVQVDMSELAKAEGGVTCCSVIV